MIEQAFGWIGKLAEFFGAFFPRLLIIKSSHAGVKYVRGRHPKVMYPGLHFYWPLVTDYETCPTVRQVLNLASQTLETKCGATVVVGGLVVYVVQNTLVFLAENENAYDTIDDVATGAIRRVIVRSTLEELRAGGAKLDHRLTREVQKDLVDFGVGVEYARLTDFARVRAINLTGQSLVQVDTKA